MSISLSEEEASRPASSRIFPVGRWGSGGVPPGMLELGGAEATKPGPGTYSPQKVSRNPRGSHGGTRARASSSTCPPPPEPAPGSDLWHPPLRVPGAAHRGCARLEPTAWLELGMGSRREGGLQLGTGCVHSHPGLHLCSLRRPLRPVLGRATRTLRELCSHSHSQPVPCAAGGGPGEAMGSGAEHWLSIMAP